MKSLNEYLDAYQQRCNQAPNKLMPYIGAPAVYVALLMLLHWISIDLAAVWTISFSWILTIALVVYYFFIDIKVAVAALIVLFAVALVADWLAGPTPSQFSFILFLLLFVGGAALLFIAYGKDKSKSTIIQIVMDLPAAPLFLIVLGIRALKLESFFDLGGPSGGSTGGSDTPNNQ